MKKLYYSLLLCLITISATAQNEFAENWFFGSYGEISFASGSASFGTNSAMYSLEGCTSYSDQDGNLLFYSNGGDVNLQNDGFVWNANHQVMQNGTLMDTAGCQSSIQSAITVPKPGSSSEYYLFTTDCFEHSPGGVTDHKGLRYSEIDMTMDGGLGAVTQKGVPLSQGLTPRIAEGMAVTRHANGTDFWLVIHNADTISNDTFFVYQVTASGITGPTTQKIGQGLGGGQMKISVAGNKLAYATDLFDFDNATGTISNPIDLAQDGYGRAFSPDGRYLYITEAFTLYQLDLQAANIAQSKISIDVGSLNEVKGSMQIGPDCKIYVSEWRTAFIGIINNPNVGGAGCNYENDVVQMPFGTGCEMGLPNFVDSDFSSCDPSSVQDQYEQVNWNLYPNPAREILTVERYQLNKPWTVTVLNALGEEVIPVISVNSQQQKAVIDLSHLAAGLFFVQVEEAGQTSLKKFVHKR